MKKYFIWKMIELPKSKQIVDDMLATGANTLLIASPEVDEVVENLLVSKKVFSVRISTEEIEYLARYTGAKPIRMIEDLKKNDILGTQIEYMKMRIMALFIWRMVRPRT